MASQHNLATKGQLLSLDLTRGEVDGLVRRGHLEAVHRGVLRLAGCHQPEQQQVHANVLRAGTGARADGLATLALLGIEHFGLDRYQGVLVPHGRGVTGVQFPVRKVACLPRGDLAAVAGVPALRVTRAVMDAAPSLDGKMLRTTVDDAWRRGLLRHQALVDRARRDPLSRGAQTVLRAYAAGSFLKESEGERAMERFLSPLGLCLEWGVADVVPGRRLDALERSLALVFEFDGRAHHVAPSDRDRDRLRDLACAAVQIHGVPLLVVRLTWGMMRDHPEETLRRIRALIDQRRDEVASRRERR